MNLHANKNVVMNIMYRNTVYCTTCKNLLKDQASKH